MNYSLPLFDGEPYPAEPESVVLTPRVNDISRAIQHKAGPFIETLGGQPTGRTFRAIELLSGQWMTEWDDGSRTEILPTLSPIYIADGLRFGTLVSVEVRS